MLNIIVVFKHYAGGVETVPETYYQQDSGVLDVLCEASSSSIASDDHNHDTNEACDEERSSSCLKSVHFSFILAFVCFFPFFKKK